MLVMAVGDSRAVPLALRERLRRANLSELGRLSGVSRSSLVSMRDHGRALPSTISRVANVLETPEEGSAPAGTTDEQSFHERLTSIITRPDLWRDKQLLNEERMLLDLALPMSQQQRYKLLSGLFGVFGVLAESEPTK